MNNNKTLLLVVVFIISSNLFSDDVPNWVNFEQAKSSYKNGDFSQALDFFINISKRDLPYPEAEYMIGLIYLEEGELELAEDQVKKAIESSSYLEVYQDLLEYKYTLSKIYLLKRDYQSYEEVLKEIVNKDISEGDIKDQNAYYETLIKSGMDRVLHLYRKETTNILNANIALGLYYNYLGEYKKSVNYLLPPIIALITEVIEDNKQFQREYEFNSLSLFFEEILDNNRSFEYLVTNDFFRIYYYLGQSLLGLGHKNEAKKLWIAMSEIPINSRWVNMAKNQIYEPYIDKITELF